MSLFSLPAYHVVLMCLISIGTMRSLLCIVCGFTSNSSSVAVAVITLVVLDRSQMEAWLFSVLRAPTLAVMSQLRCLTMSRILCFYH